MALLLLALIASTATAFEQRKFYNADRTKSFLATLADYDEAKSSVTVRLESGKKKRFNIKLLSKKDQEYIKKNAQILFVSRSFDVRFKEVKGDVTRSKSGLIRTRKTPTSYSVELYNRSKNIVENVDIRYTFYYCVGSSSASGPRHSPKVMKGVLSFPKMYGQYSDCLLYTSPSPRDKRQSRMPSSA